MGNKGSIMDLKSKIDLSILGIKQEKNIKRNLPMEMLIEETVMNGEGVLGMEGAVMVDTGTYTGRSPNDKYFVVEKDSKDKIWWGPVNAKVSASIFEELYAKVIKSYDEISDTKTYIFDGFAGADKQHALPIRVISKKAWQNHFCQYVYSTK